MSLSRGDVEHIARLARLALSEEELRLYTEQLARILDYIHKLNELDTSRVEPLYHAGALQNVFREDVAQPGLPREQALQNAPQQARGFFRVPRVIE